ncbi:MAG: hypothetical protein JRJ75_11075 [Deltaproteobacteria bacterium]|nr:hypothetical protein [Deltaproteobacteria bacterium]
MERERQGKQEMIPVDDDGGPFVTLYDSFEEMMEDLGRAIRRADTMVRPTQAAIRAGQYFINLRHGRDLPIFGEVLDIGKLGYDEEEQEYINNQYAQPHMRFFRPTRCYSMACPEGEVGDTHLSEVDAIIDRELFEHYRENGWHGRGRADNDGAGL